MYGATPPVATKLAEYTAPVVPLASVDVVITSGVATTVIWNWVDTVCAAASVACTVNVAGPTTVGVPEITPELDRFNPVGNDPDNSEKVTGAAPPVVTTDALYGVPLVPFAKLAVVIERAVGLMVIEK